MLFNSLLFLFFLLTVLSLYYVLPVRFRWLLLLAASLVFYAAFSLPLLFLMLAVVAVNYGAAMGIARYAARKKLILALAAAVSFGALFLFKYAGFFSSIWSAELRIVLPMGISFYTFQAVGYTVDVYRDPSARQKNFLKLTLFITFFPQLVAGPIERAENLMPQLFTAKRFTWDSLTQGIQYMLLGFFKKLVIADRVAAAVNTVYGNPAHYAGLASVIATWLFAFQIYCDFSGYSDIAKGAAKLLGIDLMDNFRAPYFAKGIRAFWRRWHISLSAWFKDYLYFPLGGSRVSRPRHYLNTMITFLVSGLWHGANFTFVIWGALHGVYQVLGLMLSGLAKRAGYTGRGARRLHGPFTFALVCFAWIFFRANSAADAFYIAGHLFSDAAQWLNPQYLYDVLVNMGVQLLELCVAGGAILWLWLMEAYACKRGGPHAAMEVRTALAAAPSVLRMAAYAVCALAILSTGVFGGANTFIYFQF